jgi:uncharacterized protein YndB with AHSA1/START domain
LGPSQRVGGCAVEPTEEEVPVPKAAVTIEASPEEVFDALQDASAYPEWVVGAKRVRAVDGQWPQRGGGFHHTVGVGPLATDDSTEVVESQPPHHLRLEVRFRPVGTAVVDIEVAPAGAGSRVVMAEAPLQGAVRRWWNPVVSAAVVARNHLSLLRLRSLVQRRAARRQPRSSS